MDSPIQELESLLFDWESGEITEPDLERLRDLLRTDPAARTFFARHQMLSAAMRLDADSGMGVSAAGEPSASLAGESRIEGAQQSRWGTERSSVLRVNYWFAAAAVLAVCLLGVRLVYLEANAAGSPLVGETNEERTAATREPTSQGIALVTRLVDVVWAAGQEPVEVGDALKPGGLAIDSGFAQIEFFCGATVIVEGPADLELKSPLLAAVRSGRLRAQVPPAARGFSLAVDDMTVVDLGTEFGLSVSSAGANVQVFDGEVEIQQPDSAKRSLLAGSALVRARDGTYQETEVTPERFLNIAALASRFEGQSDQRFERWRSWSETLRRDKRLIAYYAFDQQGGWQRRLDSSLEPRDRELDGAIVGAHRVPGRWSDKGALDFKRPGDRVRVHLPGEYGSLTFVCWTKIDSLDRWYNSLFLTDHYDQGEPHWQILDSGQLFFSVRHKPDDVQGAAARSRTHHQVLSPPFWKPSLSGRWIHLATAYDAETGKITHFFNGEVLHEETIDEELRVATTRIGAASIGNWSIPTRPDAEFAIRNLNGSIDEFAIFAAALPAAEIKSIFDQGKP